MNPSTSQNDKERGAENKSGCSSQRSFCISPIRFTSSDFSHLEELGVDGLVGLPEHRDEVAGLPHVVGGEEGIGRACLLATCRSANAVDIVLRVVGVVKVDDKFHVFNICKIVLRCGRGKRRTAHFVPAPPQQPDQEKVTLVLSRGGKGLKIHKDVPFFLLKQNQKALDKTYLVSGETTAGREKRCTLHSLPIHWNEIKASPLELWIGRLPPCGVCIH